MNRTISAPISAACASRFAGPLLAALVVMLAPAAAPGVPNFIAPGGQTTYVPADGSPVVLDWPVTDWTRGAADTTYAEWDTFGWDDQDERDDNDSGDFALPNVEPDVGYSGFADPSDAAASETTGAGFYTGSGNIYSFSAVLAFEAKLPGPAAASGQVTHFVAQVNTVATEFDPNTVRLSYNGAAQQLAPLGSLETQRSDASGGGFDSFEVTTLLWWEVAGDAPAEFHLEFDALGTSMSLANLALDAYTPSSLPGDYDQSGAVDGLDYIEWRNQYGATVEPYSSADGNGDGLVNSADYTIWRDSLNPPLAGLRRLAVPEPSVGGYAGLFAVAIVFCWGSHRCVTPRD